MEKYITKKPLLRLPPKTGVYLILDESKKQVAQLTCDDDYYNALVKTKNLEPLDWTDFTMNDSS